MDLPALFGRTTRGTQMVRRGRISAPGHVYFVTTIVRQRAPVFADWIAASAACRIAHETLGDSRFIAWVLMPDHFHGLLRLGEHTSLSRSMQLFKGRTAKVINGLRTSTDRLWQNGFYDHALRQEEDLKEIARYIVLNPVRGGLTRRASDYPYWNADWL